uniref:Decapping nuclease n=1 Tax=Xenopsylla cheopis TaxID=163159 RepID=A0A6M2DXJ8_XENCH
MNNTLIPSDYRKSNKHFPNFSRPSLAGYFSVDKDRNVVHNLSQLRFLHTPLITRNIGFNLNQGINTALSKDNSTDEKIDHLLKFFIHNPELLYDYNEKTRLKVPNVDIVCFRGLLTTLMCTPFESRDDWNILAHNWNDTVYLCAWESEERKEQKERDLKFHKKFMYWGYKFEQYLLSRDPETAPNTTEPVIETEEFCGVFKSKLNNLKLLYGAEMDGIDISKSSFNYKDLKNARFVELKTNRIMTTERQYQNFNKFKTIKWWCQSFLVGIDEILCGCRDDNGILLEIKSYKVKDIPKTNNNSWDATGCMNFCYDVLEHMYRISKSQPNQTILFSWNPGGHVSHKVDNFKAFLPSWYFTAMSQHLD